MSTKELLKKILLALQRIEKALKNE